MIWWHRVGQKVVCIDNGACFSGIAAPELQMQNVFTISRIGIGIGCPVALWLEEVKNTPFCGYDARRFKPVRETSIESLRELLNPTPEQKREVFQEMIEEKQRELAR